MKKLLAILVACLMPICLIAGSGDVNGDGVVSVADIDAIIGYIMKTSPSVTKEAADVNEDGDVNASDIVELINFINQPAIITEDIGDWSEMRVSADGSLITVKNMEGREMPEEVLMILPSEELGVLYSYIKFDENEVPKYITLNDNIIIVDSYDGYFADLTVVYENTAAYTVKGVPFSSSGVSKTRAANENNMVRNVTAWVELASGVAGVVGGSLLVAGSIVSEAGTLGASTPVSVLGVLAGSATIVGGCSTFKSGWDKLWSPGAHTSNIGGTIGFQAAGELILKGPQNAYVPDQYVEYLRDPKYSSQLSKAGWINFAVGLTAGIADNLYGRTVTWEDLNTFYNKKDENGIGKVVTGLSKDITSNSATLRAYISPNITISQLDGSPLENEYGIIVVSTSDSSDRQLQMNSGSGGMIEFNFNNLKPCTVYNYRVYYKDKTNVISLLGEVKSFVTEPSLPLINNFEQLSAEYKPNAFTNKDREYSYRYHCATTVEIEDLENVEDWGYVYVDKEFGETKLSLMEHGQSYRDSRYAYYRNSPKDNVTFYTYVKYKDSDKKNSRSRGGDENDFYYSDPVTFDLIYKEPQLCPDDNHPHMIDLGLPSGTKWACCNVGASNPGETGGYYAWGEINEKNEYVIENYANYDFSHYDETQNPVYPISGFINIGSDISGTSYDVAHALWGDSWQMPSADQCRELINKTTSSWKNQNGVNGLMFIGMNGNSVFIPAAGDKWNKDSFGIGERGSYWTSTQHGAKQAAFCFYVNPEVSTVEANTRFGGMTVRPVQPGIKIETGEATIKGTGH